MKRLATVILIAVAGGLFAPAVQAGNERSEIHQQYAATVWKYIQETDYKSWPVLEGSVNPGVGPLFGQATYVKRIDDWAQGSEIISEHWAGDELVGVSVFLRQADGYSQRNRNWYWVTYTAAGEVVSASPDKEPHRRRGYVTWVIDGRLWVFVLGSKEAADFVETGDLAKNVTRIAAGPNRMTVRSSDAEVIDGFLAIKDGFFVWPVEGRLWVYDSDDPGVADFLAGKEPSKVVIRPGAGPNRMTIKGTESRTLLSYVVAQDGFKTFIVDERIWVFKADAEELADFVDKGELAKQVIRPAAGPLGMTVKAPDSETINAYLAAVSGKIPEPVAPEVPETTEPEAAEPEVTEPAEATPPAEATEPETETESAQVDLDKAGFVTKLLEGRLWVFKEGAEELEAFNAQGELAKHVIRPAAGPGGVTLKGPDSETLDAYIAARDGFVTFIDDGRIWAFKADTEELEAFQRDGELAKNVTRPGAGPGGMTVRAPDAETLDAYLN